MNGPLEVVVERGSLVESRHAVHAVAVDADGRATWIRGRADQPTLLRSAAKPFQALPLVSEGVLERFGLDERALALACGSHGGEPVHVELAASVLAAAGVDPSALGCGPHAPMHGPSARALEEGGGSPSRLHNNCSGKHAGMLALAAAQGWPVEGYWRAEHPVQRRMLQEVARWTGEPEERIGMAVDGCGVVCFQVPLRSAAGAFARLGAAAGEGRRAPAAVLAAMTRHPYLVAGTGRLCTALAEATGGAVVAKVGAEGVYGAAVPGRGLGLALKVADGARRAAEVALLAALEALEVLDDEALERLVSWREPALTNTRDEVVGRVRAEPTAGAGR